LVVDEAHLLTNPQLEDLRLLTNADMDSHSLLAVILVGHLTLRRRIKLGVFAALDQRVTARCCLDGMSLEDTKTYITHHIKLAGRDDLLFSADAAEAIFHHSRGLPRVVNNLALQALLASCVAKKNMVDLTSVKQAIHEATDE